MGEFNVERAFFQATIGLKVMNDTVMNDFFRINEDNVEYYCFIAEFHNAFKRVGIP